MEHNKKEFLEKIRMETISRIMIEANKKMEENIDPTKDSVERIMEDELILRNLRHMCDDTIFPMLVNEEYLRIVIMDKVREVTSLFPKDKELLTIKDNKLYINTGCKEFDTSFTSSIEKVRIFFDYDTNVIEELFMSWLFYAIRKLDVINLGIEYAFEKKSEQFIYTYKHRDHTNESVYVSNALYGLYGDEKHLETFSYLHEEVKNTFSLNEGEEVDASIFKKLPVENSELLNKLLEVKRVCNYLDEVENAMQYVFRGLSNVLSCNDGAMMALNNVLSHMAMIVSETYDTPGNFSMSVDYKILKHLGRCIIGFIHNIFTSILDFNYTTKQLAISKTLYSERCLHSMMVTFDYLLERVIEDGKYFYQRPVDSTISNIASVILDNEVLISNFGGNFLTEREYISSTFGLVDKRTKRSNKEIKELMETIKSFNVGSSVERNNLSLTHNGSLFRGGVRKCSLAFYFTFETSTENAMNYIKSFYLRNVLCLNLDSLDRGDKISEKIFKYFKNKDNLAIVAMLNKDELYMSSSYEKIRRKFITDHSADIVICNTKARLASNELNSYLDGLAVINPSSLQELFSLRNGSISKTPTILGPNNILYNFLVFLKINIITIGSGVEGSLAVGRQLSYDLEKDMENRPSYSYTDIDARDDCILFNCSASESEKLMKLFGKDMESLIAIKKIMFILSEYYSITFIINTLATLDLLYFINKEDKLLRDSFSTGITNKDITLIACVMLKYVCEQINNHLGRNVFPPMLSSKTDQFSTSPSDVYEYTLNVKILNVLNSIKVKKTNFSIEISSGKDAFNEIDQSTVKEKKPKARRKSVKKPKHEYENTSDIDYKLDYINTDLDLNYIIKRLSEGKLVKCLIEGVPGSGKSEFAYHVAKELDVEVSYINVSDYSKKYVGEGEERMTKLFEDAVKHNKLVIIDECDTLFSTRDDEKLAHYVVNMTNHMLNEINKRKLNMFFTTNFLDRIDSAMIRRIDLKLKFGTLKKEHKYPLFEELIEKCSCKGKLKKEEICRRLDKIELTPGIFKSTLNKLQWVENVNVEKALEELEKESKLILKNESKTLGFCI